MRVACSTDPQEPVRRPRRTVIAPRAAMWAGAALIILALLVVARTLLLSPDVGGNQGGAAGGTAGSVAATAAASAGVAGALVDPATGEEVPIGPTATAGSNSASGGSSAASGESGASVAGVDGGAAADGDSGGSAAADSQEITVHVAGAVAAPGVVVLPSGSRVVDALEAAGGAAADADTDQLNLARLLVDGEQVRVPRVGEDASQWAAGAGSTTASGTGSGGAGSAGGSPGSSGGGAATGLININTAGASELETLPGIGPATAQKIVDFRESNGPFSSVDDLLDVPGIGDAKLEAVRDLVTTG